MRTYYIQTLSMRFQTYQDWLVFFLVDIVLGQRLYQGMNMLTTVEIASRYLCCLVNK